MFPMPNLNDKDIHKETDEMHEENEEVELQFQIGGSNHTLMKHKSLSCDGQTRFNNLQLDI